LEASQWIDVGISIGILVITVFLGRHIVDWLLGRLMKSLTKQTKTLLDDAILYAIQLPLYWTLIVLAIRIGFGRLDFLPEMWEEPLTQFYFVLDVIVGFVFIWRLVSGLFQWYGKEMASKTETNLDEQLLPFFRRVTLVFLALIGIIVLLGRFINVSSFITTLGVGSLAIALAAQAALEDSISGFLIMVDRPFRIGDRIEIQALNTWGDVVDIGLRSTHIRTRDNRMVIIPNSVIGKSLIVNHAYPNTQYRIEINIGVAYGIDIENARQTMIDAVRKVDGVLADHPVEALFLEFGNSALIFRVRWWIDSYIDTRRMFDKVNTAIYKALEKAGIEIPYNKIELVGSHLVQDLREPVED
jgi:small-conductance mechanosensitive channel